MPLIPGGGLPPTISLGGGPGPDSAPPVPSAGGGGGSEDKPLALIRQMISLGKQYIDVEPDPEDKATMGKLIATLLAYEAKDQKENDAAMGAGPAVKALRRNTRGG